MKTSLPNFIEFEIGSYCNRTCAWCPNSTNDRGNGKLHVNPGLWKGVLRELGNVHYSGWIGLHGYNEPTVDEYFWQRLTEIGQFLPSAKIAVYTNGDYLNRNFVYRLAQHHVAELRVTLYPPDNASGCSDKRFRQFQTKMSLKLQDMKPGKRGLELRTTLCGVPTHIICPDTTRYSNRASTVMNTEYVRDKPCWVPTYSAAIDYLGNVKLCCQVQEASTSNKTMMGKIDNAHSFLEIWFSKNFESVRSDLQSARFEQYKVCSSCDFSGLEPTNR